MILRQLRRRLGIVEALVESQIKALPLGELETLGENLLDFGSAADLTAWLQIRQSA